MNDLPRDPSANPNTAQSIARVRNARWLFFDVGYTLFDETGGWREQFERLAAILTEQGRPTSPVEIWNVYQQACGDFVPKQWRAVCEAFAMSASQVDELQAINATWRHDLEQPFPGVSDAIARLSSRYSLGIIANQAHGTASRLQKFGLLQHFEVVISSAEAGVVKPDPAIFQMALREANCEPDEAAMIGDRIDNDIAPANRIGMASVHVLLGGSAAQRPRTPPERPTLIVADVPRLAELLLSIE